MSPRVTAAIGRTFSSVRTSRNFRLYLFGQTVSAIGTWMNFTASAWLVLQLTDSGTALGANVALYFLPVLLLGAYGGVLADRFDKRHILMLTQAAYGIVALALWALVASDVVELWMVYALSLASGIVTAIDNPSRQSFYIEMVGEEHVRNAVSLNSAAFTGSRVFGPAIAGVLIATVGIATCFLIDGLSYAAVLIALAAMRPRRAASAEALDAGTRAPRRGSEVRVGHRRASTPAARDGGGVHGLVQLRGVRSAARRAHVRRRRRHVRRLSALAGVGSFLGAIVMASRVSEPRMRDLALWAVAAGVSLVVAGLAPTLWLAGAAMIPMGFTIMAFMITGNTMLQLNARPEAGAGDGAVRHRLPRLDSDRRSDRRRDRRAPRRPGRASRSAGSWPARSGSPCSPRDAERSGTVRRRRTRGSRPARGRPSPRDRTRRGRCVSGRRRRGSHLEEARSRPTPAP